MAKLIPNGQELEKERIGKRSKSLENLASQLSVFRVMATRWNVLHWWSPISVLIAFACTQMLYQPFLSVNDQTILILKMSLINFLPMLSIKIKSIL